MAVLSYKHPAAVISFLQMLPYNNSDKIRPAMAITQNTSSLSSARDQDSQLGRRRYGVWR